MSKKDRSPLTRSEIMSRVRGKDTKPEMTVRRGLHARGYRFRLQAKKLPGKPDLVLPKWQVAIQVHGCFWHGHEGCGRVPKSRTEFWTAKFERNRARDVRTSRELRELGWRVLVVWECALVGPGRWPLDDLLDKIDEWIRSEKAQGEFQTLRKNKQVV